jgi:cyclopropane fatty-acyl-phospholipid synthase-like methyltransferase
MKYLISLIIAGIFITSCTSSSEENRRRYNQFKEKQEQKLKTIAKKYNAIYTEPYSTNWSGKYTYQVQEKFVGKKIIFEAKLVDIVKYDNVYQLQFGDNYISNTTFFFESTYKTIKKIVKYDSKDFIVVATVKSIKPFTDSDPFSSSLDRIVYGQSYVVKGILNDIIPNSNPNN